MFPLYVHILYTDSSFKFPITESFRILNTCYAPALIFTNTIRTYPISLSTGPSQSFPNTGHYRSPYHSSVYRCGEEIPYVPPCSKNYCSPYGHPSRIADRAISRPSLERRTQPSPSYITQRISYRRTHQKSANGKQSPACTIPATPRAESSGSWMLQTGGPLQ